MELGKVIENRRSIRSFNDKVLAKDIIVDILNYAILAPSAKNRQPWYFVIVQNKDLKQKIGDSLYKKMDDVSKTTSNVIKDCQALVLVYADIEDMVMDTVSVGAGIENMILRATDLGVASLWIGFILNIEEELSKNLQINKKLISAVAFGYTDTIPLKRPRKPLEEVSRWYL